MNTNKFYVDDMEAIDPKRVGELHMLVLLLLDTSGSMSGAKIRNLQASVNRFKSDIMSDPKVADIVDVCVMGFNGEPYLIQEWRPVSEMNDVCLEAAGGTNLTAALTGGNQKMRERTNLALKQGIEIRVPWIILISDGYGGDVTEIAKIMRERTKKNLVRLWFLGVPDLENNLGYDKKTADLLTDRKRVFELTKEGGYDFTQFFKQMSMTVKAVSTSAPNETVQVEDLSEQPNATFRKVTFDDWLNE